MIKGVIFDLDGTLLHTLPDLHDSINATLRNFGYPEISEIDTLHFICHGARDFVFKSLPQDAKDNVEACLAFFGEYYEKSGSPRTALFDGIDGVLKKLAEQGVKLGIVTNKPQRNAEDVYRRYLSAYPFTYVTGQVEGVDVKPDPTLTLQCIKAFGLEKQQVVFVGDGETDVQTAINAGIQGIAVTWGYRQKTDLKKAGAVHFADTPEMLLDMICSL